MQKKFQLVFTIIFSFALGACRFTPYDQFTKLEQLPKAGEKAVGDNGASDKLTPEQKISYQFVKNYAFSNCLSCHSGSKSPNLTVLAEIEKRKTDIWNVIESKKMPPSSSGYVISSACQKDLIKRWFDLNNPEKTDIKAVEIASCKREMNHQTEPQPETPILQMPLNYKSLADRILKPKCTGCHSAGGEAEDILFYPYDNLMLLERLWKAPAVESQVFKSFTDAEGPMPPKDSKIEALTKDEVEFVRRWIDAGKPEK